jgi:hypothetical protein
LAEPRKLIEQLAADVGVRVVGLDRIPHDLWPGASLPPLSFAERLTLISAGFEMTFEFSRDGTALRFVPIPDQVALERSYSVPTDIRSRAAQLSKMFPESTIRSNGNTLSVVALLEDHNTIRDLLDGKSVSRPTVIGATRRPEVRIASLKVENKPVGAVIEYLAEQLKIEVEFDHATKSRLSELVSFTVRDATQQQVFKAALDPVGLSFRLQDGKLTVIPGTR